MRALTEAGVQGRDLEALKGEFAIWYFDPDKSGSQKGWAEEHGVHPTTLSSWKAEDWFVAEQEKWKERLERHFGSIMYAAYKRATDTDSFNQSQIQAARFVADMLGKTPPKKIDARVDVFTWLQQVSVDDEGTAEGVFTELPPSGG